MSGIFEGVENKEIYIIGTVLFLLLLSNNFSFTGLASSRNDYQRDVYEKRNPDCLRCFSDERPRQEASMAARPNVGHIRPNEYRSQYYPQMLSSVGGPCYFDNGDEGISMLGEGNSRYCRKVR